MRIYLQSQLLKPLCFVLKDTGWFVQGKLFCWMYSWSMISSTALLAQNLFFFCQHIQGCTIFLKLHLSSSYCKDSEKVHIKHLVLYQSCSFLNIQEPTVSSIGFGRHCLYRCGSYSFLSIVYRAGLKILLEITLAHNSG